MLKFYYEWDGLQWRWWREGDAGDQFETLTKTEHEQTLKVCQRLRIPCVQGMPVDA